MANFDIDPDIRKAKTLSSEFYTDQQYFELSKERIFTKSWQLIGTKDEIDNLKPLTLLENFLDEPVLIIKNNNGSFNCFSNVCTHRGKVLVEEPAAASLIRCGYHGRRFSLAGKFLSMPEFDGVENFPSDSDNLPRIASASWGNFLFASVDPAAPFEDFMGGTNPLIDIAAFSGSKLVSKHEYEVNAHWALYCENYLEGFHIPFVHHSLNEIVDYGSYTTETFRYSSLQTALSEPGAIATGLDFVDEKNPVAVAAGSDPDMIAGRYLFIFPNLMFNFYPWGISVNIVKPISPGKTKVEFLKYVSDESKVETGAGADLHRVELEDEKVVESVQKGIRSRFYSHGKYSPTREQGTHHFHRLIAEFMK
ncbi:MAG: aromatic ring-hydroxylating dioxygenase subunit alpha [Saprospiraceae bacterium]|nr:aromatic ring-hydroxylating dioxygenase subunit alpha [Pyrinomonadaceae bacterium]